MTNKPKIRKTCKWCQQSFWAVNPLMEYCPSNVAGKNSKCMMKARQWRYINRLKNRLSRMKKLLSEAGIEVKL